MPKRRSSIGCSEGTRLRHAAYLLAQATWGLPQTALGLAVFLVHAGRPHFRYHGAIVTTWPSRKALSAGPFVFLNGPGSIRDAEDGVDGALLVHEYGHTVQSLLLGPLYLPVIGLPSALWLNAPALRRLREDRGASYYSFFTEVWANRLGERFLGEPSPSS